MDKSASFATFLLSGTLLATAALAQGAPEWTGNAGKTEAPAPKNLLAEFSHPPASARPRVWWHWMNGNITQDGIRKDIAWMKRIGIGGMQTFDASIATPQIVDRRLVYMTPEWKQAFRLAAQLADQNDLELGIAASPGWSETGGPWVKPEDGMKKLVWSETIIHGGGQRRRITIAPPPRVTGPYQDIALANPMAGMTAKSKPALEHYADIALLAYPAAAATPSRANVTDGAKQPIDAALLVDDSLSTAVEASSDAPGKAPTLNVAYAQPQTVRAVTLFVTGGTNMFGGRSVQPRLEASDDNRRWRKIADLDVSKVPTTVSFPAQTARYFRLVLDPAAPSSTIAQLGEPAPGADPGFLGTPLPPSKKPVKVAMLRLWANDRIDRFEHKAGFELAPDYYALSPELPDAKGIDPGKVINLTGKLRQDGMLDWSPPRGTWRIVRFGYSLLGTTNHPAPVEATGLEVDKFDGEAVRRYLEYYLQTYRDAAGPDLIGHRGVRALLTDSIEAGAANWTPKMVQQFVRLRGYDPTPWMPALTGEIVHSRSQSDKFLYDFRRTMAELIASEHYGTLAQLAHENKLKVYGEALEDKRPSIGDDMAMRSFADVPMAAMWTYGEKAGPRPTLLADIKGAASVAHIYGQNIVAAESLTSMLAPWGHAPSDLRPVMDLEFVTGINRPVIHTSVHQPLDTKVPGVSLLFFGQYFNRHESWAEMAKPWVDYLTRSSYLLQQGRHVADVAYFYGEEAPLTGLYGEKPVADAPVRYAFDFANVDVLMKRLSVEDGDLVAASGARYRALYLGGSSAKMTLATLRRVAELVEAGATVVGTRPKGSPQLSDDPEAYNALADRLWTGQPVATIGKGRVIDGKDIEDALRQIGVVPDFAYTAQHPDAELLFLHRKLDEGDIYFVSNRRKRQERIEARFRTVGKAPEIWRADSGKVEPLSYRVEGNVTVATLSLAPQESYFIVFSKPGSASFTAPSQPKFEPIAELDGPWSVSFESPVSAPPAQTLFKLAPLNESDDASVKYFSGRSTYSKSFRLPRGVRPGAPLLLDLGTVGDLAEVRVNGKLLATLWHAPFQIDIGSATVAGANRIEVKVANLWVNRLIGDAQKGATKVTYTSMPTYKPDAPLRPSGLIGPVTLAAQP
ncbi:glycosyl hydrolase [Sphingobium tyrosinilyticum]|uniref:Glycosyl hydrolase n=2 Tax=Sphingobium tyrosinilyticum TaxID=2715436 RepID=A0ABV9F4T3_9SPHN